MCEFLEFPYQCYTSAYLTQCRNTYKPYPPLFEEKQFYFLFPEKIRYGFINIQINCSYLKATRHIELYIIHYLYSVNIMILLI